MAGGADALGAVGGTIGGIIGYQETGHNRDAAQQDYENALGAYSGLGSNAHDGLAVSAHGNAQDRANQMEALARLKDVYSNQGLDAGTRAQLAAAQQSNAQQAQAMNGNVQNRMAQQGMANSGASFAQQQMNNQAAQNQNANASTSALALGQQNKMAALGQYGQLAQGMNAQDNALSQFNAQNSTGANLSNARMDSQAGIAGAQGQQSAYDNMAGNQMDQGDREMGVAAGAGKAAGSVFGMALGG